MPTLKTKNELDEEEVVRVLENRRKFFVDVMGKDWPEEEIDLLAKSDSSPHDALKLISKGCPMHLIPKILI